MKTDLLTDSFPHIDLKEKRWNIGRTVKQREGGRTQENGRSIGIKRTLMERIKNKMANKRNNMNFVSKKYIHGMQVGIFL